MSKYREARYGLAEWFPAHVLAHKDISPESVREVARRFAAATIGKACPHVSDGKTDAQDCIACVSITINAAISDHEATGRATQVRRDVKQLTGDFQETVFP